MQQASCSWLTPTQLAVCFDFWLSDIKELAWSCLKHLISSPYTPKVWLSKRSVRSSSAEGRHKAFLKPPRQSRPGQHRSIFNLCRKCYLGVSSKLLVRTVPYSFIFTEGALDTELETWPELRTAWLPVQEILQELQHSGSGKTFN